jgi:hypothetical protein
MRVLLAPLIVTEPEMLTIFIPAGVAKIQNCQRFFFRDFKNDFRTTDHDLRCAGA